MSNVEQVNPYPRDDDDDNVDLNAESAERIAFLPGSSQGGSKSQITDEISSAHHQLQWKSDGAPTDGQGVSRRAKELLRRLRLNARDVYENNVGLLLITASQFCGSCMNVSVKILNSIDPPVHPFELVAIRMFFTYLFSISYMYSQGVPYPVLGPPGVRRLLVFRGVAGFFGLFGMYYSLQYLTLSDAIVLTFLIPTVTAFLGYFFLKEGFTRGQAIAGICSLFGVVLIARPSFIFGQHTIPAPIWSAVDNVNIGQGIGPAERGTAAQRMGAVGVAMLGVIGGSGAVTSLRAIGTRAHALHSLTYFSSYSILVSIIGMIVFQIKPVIPAQFKFVLLFFVIGFFGYGAQVTLTLGLQRETASRGMLAMYVQIIFAAILERIFFHVYPSLLSLLGTSVILSCAIYVALSKKAPPRTSERDPETGVALSSSVSESDSSSTLGSEDYELEKMKTQD